MNLEKGPKYKAIYNSVEEMIADCDQTAKEGRIATTIRPHQDNFVGRRLPDWQAVKDAVKEIWDEGLDQVKDMLLSLEHQRQDLPVPTDVRRKKHWAGEGDEFSHERLQAGQDPWLTTARTQVQSQKQLTILVNLTAFAYVKANDILWRGAAAICLTDLLEQAGYRVEFWGVEHTYNRFFDGHTTFTAVKLKSMHQPVDLGTLTTSVSGWFYRTAMWQAGRKPDKEPSPGYGQVQKISQTDDVVKDIVGNSSAVIINSCSSKEKALKVVKNVIEQLK